MFFSFIAPYFLAYQTKFSAVFTSDRIKVSFTSNQCRCDFPTSGGMFLQVMQEQNWKCQSAMVTSKTVVVAFLCNSFY